VQITTHHQNKTNGESNFETPNPKPYLSSKGESKKIDVQQIQVHRRTYIGYNTPITF
jgi:hypothetical protein